MNSSLTITTLSLISMLVLVSCGGGGRDGAGGAAAVPEFPMTVETCGRTVTIEKPPQRVLTVGAEAPGLIWAAGAADQVDVIAATFGERLGAPEGTFDNVRKITPLDEKPAKEMILGENVDLVMGYGLTASRSTATSNSTAGSSAPRTSPPKPPPTCANASPQSKNGSWRAIPTC